MEHRKHSSEDLDNMIDNIYWNWRILKDEELFSSPFCVYYLPAQVWVVITLKNGYKLGYNSICGYYDRFEMIKGIVRELKRKLMYTLDYIQYMMLHKGITLIKEKDLDRLKLAKSLYELSLKEGRLIH